MPNLKNAPHLQALVLLFIAMISMQSSGALAKTLFDQFPVLTISAMRLLLGSLILAVIFKIWQVNFKQVKWPSIISYGIALAGMNALFYLSIHRIPLGIAVAFEFIGPLSVALFHARQKFDFIWVGLAILGLVLLFPFDQAKQSLDLIGIAFALAAGAVYYCRSTTFRGFWKPYCMLGDVCRHVEFNANRLIFWDAFTGF